MKTNQVVVAALGLLVIFASVAIMSNQPLSQEPTPTPGPTRQDPPKGKPLPIFSIWKNTGCGPYVIHANGMYTIWRNNQVWDFDERRVHVVLTSTGTPTVTYHGDETVTIKIQKQMAPCLENKRATWVPADTETDIRDWVK